MVRKKVRRRGAVIVWTAAMLIVFVGFMGLAIDVGYLHLTQHQLQNATDAAALAGTRVVHLDVAASRQAAQKVAAANQAAQQSIVLDFNEANHPQGDIVVGYYDRAIDTFFPQTQNCNAVQVTARHTVPLLFGKIFGVSSVEITATATASTDHQSGAALLVLDPVGAQALYIGGGGLESIEGGFVQLNSASQTALHVGNNATFAITEGARIVGCASAATMANIDGQVICDVPPTPDPLAWVPEPEQPANQPSVPAGNVRKYHPGYYPDGIEISNNDVCYFEPGIYYISTQANNPNTSSLKITGGRIHADPEEGVMFFIKRGSVSITGNPDFIHMTPMSEGPYAGISIFQSRTNYASADIRGGATTKIDGTMYFPGNLQGTNGPQVLLRGNGSGFAVRIIAWRIRQTGGVPIHVKYAVDSEPSHLMLVR